MTPIEIMTARWGDPNQRPLFKGQLIDNTGCKCAQGDVLAVLGHWSDEQLKYADQSVADKATAKLLNISTTHAVLLRNVNDSQDGAPSVVLTNPKLILGDQSARILKFWLYLDKMSSTEWEKVRAAGKATKVLVAARAAAVRALVAMSAGARKPHDFAATRAETKAAMMAMAAGARAAAGAWETTSAGGTWAVWATNEIQGAATLENFYFLPFFGFKTPAYLDTL
jgi:hypothetical protein